jgi:hypothetical protein
MWEVSVPMWCERLGGEEDILKICSVDIEVGTSVDYRMNKRCRIILEDHSGMQCDALPTSICSSLLRAS